MTCTAVTVCFVLFFVSTYLFLFFSQAGDVVIMCASENLVILPAMVSVKCIH